MGVWNLYGFRGELFLAFLRYLRYPKVKGNWNPRWGVQILVPRFQLLDGTLPFFEEILEKLSTRRWEVSQIPPRNHILENGALLSFGASRSSLFPAFTLEGEENSWGTEGIKRELPEGLRFTLEKW